MGLAVPAVSQETEVFNVRKDNWDSLCAFLDCQTQWRIATGMTGAVWLGLDYVAVDVVLRRLRLPDAVFGDLQVMEMAALTTFGEGQ